MITLSDQKTSYKVNNQTEDIILNGEAIFNSENELESFIGELITDGAITGEFVYGFDEDGQLNSQINKVSEEYYVDAATIIISTLAELRQQINNPQSE